VHKNNASTLSHSQEYHKDAAKKPSVIITLLCTVYAKYRKVMTKHSVDGLLVSLILFMQFNTCKSRKTFVYCYIVQHLKVLSKNGKPSFLVKLLK